LAVEALLVKTVALVLVDRVQIPVPLVTPPVVAGAELFGMSLLVRAEQQTATGVVAAIKPPPLLAERVTVLDMPGVLA
jgi:hypothetical protein